MNVLPTSCQSPAICPNACCEKSLVSIWSDQTVKLFQESEVCDTLLFTQGQNWTIVSLVKGEGGNNKEHRKSGMWNVVESDRRNIAPGCVWAKVLVTEGMLQERGGTLKNLKEWILHQVVPSASVQNQISEDSTFSGNIIAGLKSSLGGKKWRNNYRL